MHLLSFLISWANNLESVFQVYLRHNLESISEASDTISRAPSLTNCNQFARFADLAWVVAVNRKIYFQQFWNSQPNWTFLGIFSFKKNRPKLILRNCRELCNFSGKFDVLCSLNPIYASTSSLITCFNKNIKENGISHGEWFYQLRLGKCGCH